jgi:hypothetical protein
LFCLKPSRGSPLCLECNLNSTELSASTGTHGPHSFASTSRPGPHQPSVCPTGQVSSWCRGLPLLSLSGMFFPVPLLCWLPPVHECAASASPPQKSLP